MTTRRPNNWKLVEERRFACVDILQDCAFKLGLKGCRPITNYQEVMAAVKGLETKGFLFILPDTERRVREKSDARTERHVS